MKIYPGIRHQFLWGLHKRKNRIREKKAENSHNASDRNTKRIGGMQRLIKIFPVFRTIKLCCDHRRRALREAAGGSISCKRFRRPQLKPCGKKNRGKDGTAFHRRRF